MNNFQNTIAKETRALGVGLHSGKLIEMNLRPSDADTGVVFVRTDLDYAEVKACMENIDYSALQMATTLRSGKAVVQTTEHLMSALYGAGVDNVIVELSGPEVPIMDGSAAPFLVLIEEAGLKKQNALRKVLKIEKPFEYELDGKKVSVEPGADFNISYEIDFDHPLIRRQVKTMSVTDHGYENEIAPARTFGFLKDINYLKSLGLIQGGSLENAVVLDGDRILNESLRSNDEFVSHKILDMIGDFAISGLRFQGHFRAWKAGHEMHARFLRALLNARDCWSLVSEEEVMQNEKPAGIQEALAGAA